MSAFSSSAFSTSAFSGDAFSFGIGMFTAAPIAAPTDFVQIGHGEPSTVEAVMASWKARATEERETREMAEMLNIYLRA